MLSAIKLEIDIKHKFKLAKVTITLSYDNRSHFITSWNKKRSYTIIPKIMSYFFWIRHDKNPELRRIGRRKRYINDILMIKKKAAY